MNKPFHLQTNTIQLKLHWNVIHVSLLTGGFKNNIISDKF
jgi:hypothetical protein